MKTANPWRNATLTSLALLTGLLALTTGPDARFAGAAAAQKEKYVFQDLSALTTAQATVPPANAPAVANPLPAPAAAPAAKPAPAAPPPQSPASASVPVDETTGGKTLYQFEANALDLRVALAQFAKANNLNIIPDNDVAATVTLEVRDLPLDQMMRALLEASDCTWARQGGLIRVHSTETRTFSVDYLRLSRKGIGQSSAVLASGTSGGMGGGMSGGAGGGGMSGGTGGGSSGYGSSSVNLTADNPVDFWKELREEMGFILTEAGKRSLCINMTAGLIQVTDRPSALKRVENYLKSVETSIHRQVDIEAKIYDVTLNDQFQFGIDWAHVASAFGGSLGFGGSTLPIANGGSQLADSALGGLSTLPNVGTSGSTTPGGNLSTLVFKNFNTEAAVNALQQQGKVEVVSKPRVRTLNNQTALIKVGEDVPFFNTTTSYQQTSPGTITPVQQTLVNSITIGTILSITPQISDNDWVSLDISPVLTSLNKVMSSPGSGGSSSSSGATAPDLNTKQASTLVRVRDGTTIVLGGLIQTQTARHDKKVPLLGDIPLVGKLFTGTFRATQKQELVIFVTPHIVRDNESSVNADVEERADKPQDAKPGM